MRDSILYRCRRTWLWLAFLLCSSTPALGAENADTLTLKKALALTLTHNPQLYQYRFSNEALNAQRQTNALRPALALELEVENFAGSGSNQGLDAAESTLALSSAIELG